MLPNVAIATGQFYDFLHAVLWNIADMAPPLVQAYRMDIKPPQETTASIGEPQ